MANIVGYLPTDMILVHNIDVAVADGRAKFLTQCFVFRYSGYT
jgi:hypothetical protein